MTLRNPNDNEGIKAYDELQTAEINKPRYFKYSTKAPVDVGWQNQVAILFDKAKVGNNPYVISARYKNTNGVWLDFGQVMGWQLANNATSVAIELKQIAAAGADVEIVLLSSLFQGVGS